MHFDPGSQKAWAMVGIPLAYREMMLIVLVLNSAACYVFEKCFISWFANRYEEQQAVLRKAHQEQVLAGQLSDELSVQVSDISGSGGTKSDSQQD